jgi:hypothetical protein
MPMFFFKSRRGADAPLLFPPGQAKYTRFVVSDLEAASRYIEGLHRRAADPAAAQKAAHKKYSTPRFHSVSALPLPE